MTLLFLMMVSNENVLSIYPNFWFAAFYDLAHGCKKQPSTHVHFIIAAALTFMVPTLDRILIHLSTITYIPPRIPIELLSFALIDGCLSFLLIQELRKNRNSIPLSIALGLYILVQIFYTPLTKSSFWEKLISSFQANTPS